LLLFFCHKEAAGGTVKRRQTLLLLFLLLSPALSIYYPRLSFNESIDNIIYANDGTVFISAHGNVTVYNPNPVDDLYASGIIFKEDNITVMNASGIYLPPPFMLGNVKAANSSNTAYRLQSKGFSKADVKLPLSIKQFFYKGPQPVAFSNNVLNVSFSPGDPITLGLNITNKLDEDVNISVFRNLLSFINPQSMTFSGCSGAAVNFTAGAQYLKIEHCLLNKSDTMTLVINGNIRDEKTNIPPPYHIEKTGNILIRINNQSSVSNYSIFRQLMINVTASASASSSLDKLYIPKAERDRCYPLNNMSYELAVNVSTDSDFNFFVRNFSILRSNYSEINISANINNAHEIYSAPIHHIMNSSSPLRVSPINDSFCADENSVLSTYWLKVDYSVMFNNSVPPAEANFVDIEVDGGTIQISGIYTPPPPATGPGFGATPAEAPKNVTKEEARKYIIITKEVSKQHVNYGDVITVTIKVQSIASFNIRDLTLVDLLPKGFTVVDNGGASVTEEEPYLLSWNINLIRPGEILVFTYKAKSEDAEPGYYPFNDLYISSELTGVVGAYSTEPIIQEPGIGIPRQYTILLVKKLEWLGDDLYKVTISITNAGDKSTPPLIIRDTVIEKRVKPPSSILFGREEVSYAFTKKTWKIPSIEPKQDYSFTYFEEGPVSKTGLPDVYGADPSKIYKTMVVVPIISEEHIFSGTVRIEQFSFGLLVILGIIILIKRKRKKKEWYEEKLFAAKVGKLRQIERYLNPLKKV